MYRVELDDKAKENGLANMLAQMIKENLEKNTWKEKYASSIDGDVFINAKDAEVKVSLSFRKDKVVIFDGEIFNPDVKIEANTSDLIELTKLKLSPILHLPYPTKETAPLLKKIAMGEIKLGFSPFKIMKVVNLTRVLSIYP